MRNRYLLIAFFFSILMPSCKVTKKTIRPDIDVPEQFGMNDTDTASVADMAWWEVFKDTTLQKLIHKTLENNKDFKIASAKLEELAALKRISLAKLFPEANLSIYAQKEGLNYGGDDFKPDPARIFSLPKYGTSFFVIRYSLPAIVVAFRRCFISSK